MGKVIILSDNGSDKKDAGAGGDQPDFDDDDIKIADAIWDNIGKSEYGDDDEEIEEDDE